jgi:hypothetical protein
MLSPTHLVVCLLYYTIFGIYSEALFGFDTVCPQTPNFESPLHLASELFNNHEDKGVSSSYTLSF